ncbi:hypothetical protein V6Z11_A08G089500 [Gossypium hirsutum]
MRDKIRRAYIKAGPYQPILSEYPASNSKKHPQYSPSKDAIFCLPCFLFNSNPTSRFGSTAFTHNGFSNWKKVHDGCNCAFLTHMGKDPNLLHNNAQRAYVDLMNQAQHIDVSLDRQTTQKISANRLRLKTSIDVVRWFSFQGCAFRGHDESSGSKNRGNFLELLSLLASYDEKVEDVLKSAPQNASYTSSTIQKKILQIYANRVRNVIREEIGDRKFRIIVDEVTDESKKEQMAIILRFVDKQGQNVIFNVLLQHSFDIQNIRGQAYDGASNMRGEFNGLQALILNDCRYAYYVHCFAHQVVEVHQFFKDLSDIVNIASASSKRHDELQKAQAAEISRLVSINESLVESGKSVMYPLVDKLIRLILTLPVSAASSERAFSAMKIVKTRLRSKIEDDFLRSSLVMYIEKEIAEKFDMSEIIDDFSKVKDRRVQFK